jgi:predicted nucleic acid-binding protein
MTIVSNTSPIFYLSTIGQLDLLRQLYNEIVIPTTVFQEITNVGNTDVSAKVVPTLDWIKIQSATDRTLVNALSQKLDPGEAEAITLVAYAYAIALAVELNADRLLIDERLGRNAAIKLGLTVTGVLGILIAAKRNNLIKDIKPLLDILVDRVGFWIDEQLYTEVLQAVGELL